MAQKEGEAASPLDYEAPLRLAGLGAQPFAPELRFFVHALRRPGGAAEEAAAVCAGAYGALVQKGRIARGARILVFLLRDRAPVLPVGVSHALSPRTGPPGAARRTEFPDDALLPVILAGFYRGAGFARSRPRPPEPPASAAACGMAPLLEVVAPA